jgi:hypothetical protein
MVLASTSLAGLVLSGGLVEGINGQIIGKSINSIPDYYIKDSSNGFLDSLEDIFTMDAVPHHSDVAHEMVIENSRDLFNNEIEGQSILDKAKERIAKRVK